MKNVGKTPFWYHLNQIRYDYTVEVTNSFKRLDTVGRVPKELWTEVHNVVKEALIKIIPKEMQGGKVNV